MQTGTRKGAIRTTNAPPQVDTVEWTQVLRAYFPTQAPPWGPHKKLNVKSHDMEP